MSAPPARARPRAGRATAAAVAAAAIEVVADDDGLLDLPCWSQEEVEVSVSVTDVTVDCCRNPRRSIDRSTNRPTHHATHIPKPPNQPTTQVCGQVIRCLLPAQRGFLLMDNDGADFDEWELRFPGNGTEEEGGGGAWAVVYRAFVEGGSVPMPLRARGQIVAGQTSSSSGGQGRDGSQQVGG
jgi:hypothetical protein